MSKDHTSYKILETMSILAMMSLFFSLVFTLQFLSYAAFVLLVLGIFMKKPAGFITRGWISFAHIIGVVNSKILLSLIYFLLLTPLAFVFRLYHGDFLNVRRNPMISTHYSMRDHLYTARDMQNVW